MLSENKNAFTLIELLVVISIIALLLSVLTPILVSARRQAQKIICRSNLGQLILANIGYALENDDFYVPAALDMMGANLQRWHGVRWPTMNDPFNPLKGPLVSYLADGKVKECPGKPKLKQDSTWDKSFEKGGGGYGYNMTYIGSRIWQKNIAYTERYRRTTSITEVSKPAETLMFADCAISKDDTNLIEYSFAEPPFNGWGYSSPSIHFRHRNRANIGWCDGHTSTKKIAKFDEDNAYGVNSVFMNLGWFEPLDNTFFDLK